MNQEEKIQLLQDALCARLRYMKRWNNVKLDVEESSVSITWYDNDNKNSFEQITYPSSTLSEVIRKQKAKLLRDIPANELAIYKDVIK